MQGKGQKQTLDTALALELVGKQSADGSCDGGHEALAEQGRAMLGTVNLSAPLVRIHMSVLLSRIIRILRFLLLPRRPGIPVHHRLENAQAGTARGRGRAACQCVRLPRWRVAVMRRKSPTGSRSAQVVHQLC